MAERSAAARVLRILGGAKVLGAAPRNDLELVLLVREGLPYGALESASESLGSSLEEMSVTLHVPARTLQRRRNARRLDPVESERLLRLARVLARAFEVLGENGRAWFRRANRALGGLAPITLIDTDLGAQAVLDELGRLEHGVFA